LRDTRGQAVAKAFRQHRILGNDLDFRDDAACIALHRSKDLFASDHFPIPRARATSATATRVAQTATASFRMYVSQCFRPDSRIEFGATLGAGTWIFLFVLGVTFPVLSNSSGDINGADMTSFGSVDLCPQR
jgi:hypothetical protein